MDISLSPGNEKFIQNQIAAGIYNSFNEAINETISIAISQIAVDEITALKKDIDEGMTDIEAGRVCDAVAFMDELIDE